MSRTALPVSVDVSAERLPAGRKDGSTRTAYGYHAVRFEIPRGCTAGYMPELNVLCGIADYSTVSEQPVTRHLVAEITSSRGELTGG